MASYVNYGRRRTRSRFALSHVSAIAMFSAERLAKKFSDGEFRLNCELGCLQLRFWLLWVQFSFPFLLAGRRSRPGPFRLAERIVG